MLNRFIYHAVYLMATIKLSCSKMLCVLVILLLPGCGTSLNVLLVPDPWNSHVITFARFGVALITEGHSASMVVVHNAKIPQWIEDSEIRIYRYESIGETHIFNSNEVSEFMFNAQFAESKYEAMKMMAELIAQITPIVTKECENLLDDKDLRETLLAEHFDYAVVDNVVHHCSMNYPVTLGLDYFILTIPHALTWNFRIPDLPSFVPDVMSNSLTDDMCFSERLQNTLDFVLSYVYVNTTNQIDMTKYSPGKPILDLRELTENALFWFFQDDITVSHPRPHMPNSVSIGDIMVSEGNELPNELKTFMDQSEEGVILVAFGSGINNLPNEILDKFCSAFSLIPNKILWKMKSTPSCAEKLQQKVKVVHWMPQNDILAHPNLILFITHCGINSMMEAVYHAKPMLGFPLSLDQPYNAGVLQKKGYGITMDIANFSMEEMVENIEHIINSESIMNNMKRASGVMKDKPLSPSKRVAYWVEHIHNHGANHLRSGAFKLNIFQFLMLDIVLFICGIVIVGMFVLLGISYCCCMCARKIRRVCRRHEKLE